MLVEENGPIDHLIENSNNVNNKQEKLSFEEKAAKNELEGNIEIQLDNNNEINLNKGDNQGENQENKNLNGSFENNEIIEDKITKNDTGEFRIHKKKKKEQNNIIYYEGDEDLDTNNKIRTKRRKSNYKYHLKINKTFLKYSTWVTIIIYTIVTIISSVNFHYKRDTSPFLFCFEFLERVKEQSQDVGPNDIIYFLTDLNSFYIIHLVFLIIFISVSYLLLKGKQNEINDFFNDMSIFFMSTLLLNLPIFFLGMFTDHFYGNHFQPIFYLTLTFLSFLCMIKIFIVAKRHKYKSVSSLINISMLSSFLTAYQCYCFLFCMVYFYMNFFKPKMNENQKEYPEVEIIAGCIYFGIGIVVMTVFKDIFFVIAMVIIENGLLYAKRPNPYLLTTAIFNISIVSLNFASIIIIIFAYNKKVFRLKEKK